MSASVGTQQAFNSAILNLDSADPGQYTITLTADIFDDAVIPGGAGVGLYAINLPAGVSLTIVGAGFTLDGLDEGSGIAVLNGKVTIQSLTIEDTVAQGGNGLGSAGGGAGLGGGLFIGSGASVTLQNVTLTNDVARGGDGGPGGFGWVGGNASPILPRSAEATAGSGGAAGAFGGTNSLQVPPIPGGDGGDGQDGENGSAVSFGTTYARGGRGGNGGNGGAGQSSSVAGPGGMGGKGGNAGDGGSGGFGGSGGNGGFGGRGGFSGHSIHLGPNSTLGGTTGIVGGAGGFGGRGGTGGSFGGGGAGGTGGAGGGSENNLADDGSGMGGTGGKGGDGGTGGNGGFGAGGGGGGNGGAGATGGETEGIGGAGGQGGAGGDGGFGGGGGGSGRGGLGGDAGATQNGGPSSGSTGLGGQGDAPGSGGFGGGAGGTAPDAVQGGGGGGGLGAGGDIFVQQGGTLIMDGGLIGVGDAIGGTGGPNAGHGSNWGDSVFIQGFNDFSNFVLEAPAGQILKVTGQIADQSGVGGTGPNAGDGGVTVEGPGTVDMTGDNDFSGPIMLDSGTLEVGQDRDPEALLDFGAPAKLVLQYSAGVVTWDNPIDDFTVGDTIIVNGFVENSFFYLQDDLVMNNGSASATLDVPGLTFSPLHVVGDSINNCTTITVACFAEGTNIATASGDVPVEQLNAGDNVLTHDGRAAPVVWVGRRRIDCTRHPDPHSVWPVRVAAGTFGPGLPARDLYLSPDHAVFVDGVLIPVKYLVDGSNIVQVTTESVTYFHLELPEHGVVLAEGLPAESFFDNGDRDKFENGGGVARLFPEFSAVRREALGCAPLIVCGPIVDAVRDSVARRRQPRIGHVQRAM